MSASEANAKGWSKTVFVLLGVAVISPVLFRPATLPWLPVWCGSALSALALLGALAALWRAGRIRPAYILLFAAVLIGVLLVPQLL